MVYQNKVVAVIKVNGQVLRESGDVVRIPFGSEYSIFVKNLNSVRILVKVQVDAKDATEGTRLIVEPNATLNLERFIRNGNFNNGNRFKFIERTREIEAHRGITEDDGVVRVEYWIERVVVEEPIVRPRYYDEWIPVPRPYYPPCPKPRPYHHPRWSCSARPAHSMAAARATGRMKMPSRSRGPMPTRAMRSAMRSDAGITVAGSQSNQRFVSGAYFSTQTQSEVIVLHLRGEVEGQRVTAPVTVATKPKCETCGKANRGEAQFCGRCGTALVLV